MAKNGWMVVAVVAGIFAGAATVRAWTSGPSVTGGVNPLKTFVVAAGDWPNQPTAGAESWTYKKDVFVVPAGQTLIVTDVRPVLKSINDGNICTSHVVNVLADGVPTLSFLGTDSGTAPFVELDGSTRTGVAIQSGSTLSLTSYAGGGGNNNTCGAYGAVATGYLMHN